MDSLYHTYFQKVQLPAIKPMASAKGEKEKKGGKDGLSRVDDIEAYSRHVANFSPAGIRATRGEAKEH